MAVSKEGYYGSDIYSFLGKMMNELMERMGKRPDQFMKE
jgi:hypothetical protein